MGTGSIVLEQKLGGSTAVGPLSCDAACYAYALNPPNFLLKYY